VKSGDITLLEIGANDKVSYGKDPSPSLENSPVKGEPFHDGSVGVLEVVTGQLPSIVGPLLEKNVVPFIVRFPLVAEEKWTP
jgi:hypothetical protein